ncbi:putative Homeodomain-like, Homeodomain-related, Homeobox protein [Pseudoloma neurophilia]|uniref:Putative Homeodomain-like, Homeodomain-related, Homeobox protein n=1 Tax=Pseudoloma neurophilia TaxID=146866 RepID=A0A0R0M096_9MICR|nr:putative Homeodomain-like, Homeodomain-related, Homeobox protein [Pseudoloma neurophilia]
MEPETEIKKRQRTILTNEQTRYLQTYFFHNTFPTKEERDIVARKLNMPPRTIQIWFQNMRQKVKNKSDKDVNEFRPLDLLADEAIKILERKKRLRFHTEHEHGVIKNDNSDTLLK